MSGFGGKSVDLYCTVVLVLLYIVHVECRSRICFYVYFVQCALFMGWVRAQETFLGKPLDLHTIDH